MTGWRWLVAPGVQPAPGALDALEDAAARRPDARLVASHVQGVDGRPAPPSVEPWPELFDKARAMEAAGDRLLAVRAVHGVSLLVREDVLAEHGQPPSSPWGADLVWSARILADGGGYLAPGSVVTTVAAPPPRAAELRGRARLLMQPGLTPQERLWLAFLLLRRAIAPHP